jgi:hypothetical protein
MGADLDRAALPVDLQRVRKVILDAFVERYAVEVILRKRSAEALVCPETRRIAPTWSYGNYNGDFHLS